MKTFSIGGENIKAEITIELDSCRLNLSEIDNTQNYGQQTSVELSHLDLSLLAQLLSSVSGIKIPETSES